MIELEERGKSALVTVAVGRLTATHRLPTTQNGITMATTDAPLTDREIQMALTIDDIETRRAHMHRMLSNQRFLLRNALDAIRDGNLPVADEMVDRFLTHVDAELTYQTTPETGV